MHRNVETVKNKWFPREMEKLAIDDFISHDLFVPSARFPYPHMYSFPIKPFLSTFYSFSLFLPFFCIFLRKQDFFLLNKFQVVAL